MCIHHRGFNSFLQALCFPKAWQLLLLPGTVSYRRDHPGTLLLLFHPAQSDGVRDADSVGWCHPNRLIYQTLHSQTQNSWWADPVAAEQFQLLVLLMLQQKRGIRKMSLLWSLKIKLVLEWKIIIGTGGTSGVVYFLLLQESPVWLHLSLAWFRKVSSPGHLGQKCHIWMKG